MKTFYLMLGILLGMLGMQEVMANQPHWVACYRLVKVTNAHQEHFYTISEAEKQQAINDGYVLEVDVTRPNGIAFYLSNTAFTGSKEVYRLKKVGNGFLTRLYTTNPVERDLAVQSGYQYEQVIGYVSASHINSTVSVYRSYKASIADRFYTIDHTEFLATLNDGYVQETTLGYVATQPSSPYNQVYLQQLEIDVNPHPIEIQSISSLHVLAHYSNGQIVDVTSDNQLQFTIMQTLIISRPTDTTLKGLAVGSASLTATLAGITKTELVQVVDTHGPIISITSHTHNQIVDDQQITLRGTTADPSGVELVTVNGANPQGKMNFNKSLTLIPGNNLITVMAKDYEQNMSVMQITLIYQTSAPNPSPNPMPIQRTGFQGVQYDIENSFAKDELISDAKMYVLTQFLQSAEVKEAMQQASWAANDALNVDMQDDSLWIKDVTSGKETGIAFHKEQIKLFENTSVKVMQRYQKMRIYDPLDAELDGKEVLFSIRVIMQKQPFTFLETGSLDGLITVEIVNNRYVQIMSSGAYFVRLEDGSTLPNANMLQEMFVDEQGFSYYRVNREMIDLLTLESISSWGNTVTVMSYAENHKRYVNMANVVLHMTSSVFMQRSFQGKTHYAGFLSLPGLDFTSVQNYLFSLNKEKVPELEEQESKKGYFNTNKEKLKQIDKGFFNMLDLKTFVSSSTRKQKYLWAFKAISGLDSKVTKLFEDANFFISASEIVELIQEGKYAAAFVELAAEFAGEVVASSLVTAGVSGVCTGSALTGPGSIAICGAALIASPAAYVSIGNTTYSFVQHAGMKSFAMFFDGFAYLFGQQKAQSISEFIGFDWVLYEKPGTSSSSSWSKTQQSEVIQAQALEVLSCFDQGNTNLAITTKHSHKLRMQMALSDTYELHVIELALLDLCKDMAHKSEFSVEFIHEGGDISEVRLSLTEISSVTSYQGEWHMAQFLLSQPLILQKGSYTIEISHANGQEYQLCWLTQGSQQYHRFLGKLADSTAMAGCSFSSRYHDFFTPYFFLILIILLILSKEGSKKVRIRI